MTTSSSLQDAVAYKLKQYMNISRREEGFDLSSPHSPMSFSLPYNVKTHSTLSYAKLQDRSLKHYFTPQMIRTQIANLEAMPPGTQRERDVKQRLRRSVRRSTFEDLVLTNTEIKTEAYKAQLQALRKMERDTARRLQLKLESPRGNFRRRVSPQMSKSESKRIIGHASQILVATETVALAQEILSQQYGNEKRRPQSAPTYSPTSKNAHSKYDAEENLHGIPERPYTSRSRRNLKSASEKRRMHHPKYCWDVNGRRVPVIYEGNDNSDGVAMSSASSSTYDSSTLSSRHSNKYQSLSRYNRPMSAKGPRTRPEYSTMRDLRERPFSADVIYVPYGYQKPSRPTQKSQIGDYAFLMDNATQTTEDVASQTDLKGFVSKNSATKICKYNIKIWTGEKSGAGTRADVYVVLDGEKERTEELFLTKNVNGTRPFKKGQVDVFNIEAVDVGKLKHIGIGHDQKERDFSWYVTRVQVTSGDKVWEFPCKRWFSGISSDKHTFRYLKAKERNESAGSISSLRSGRNTESGKQRKMKKNSRSSRSSRSASSRSSRSSSSSHSSAKKDSRSESSSDSETSTRPATAVRQKKPKKSKSATQKQKKPTPFRQKVKDKSSADDHESESTLEYSSDSSKNKEKRVVESVVEESQDSPDEDSDSTHSTKSVKESIVVKKKLFQNQTPSASHSRTSSSVSSLTSISEASHSSTAIHITPPTPTFKIGSFQETLIVSENTADKNLNKVENSEALKVSHDLDAIFSSGKESSSSFSEPEDKNERKNSIFEMFDKKSTSESSSSSDEGEHEIKEEIVENSEDNKSRNFAAPSYETSMPKSSIKVENASNTMYKKIESESASSSSESESSESTDNDTLTPTPVQTVPNDRFKTASVADDFVRDEEKLSIADAVVHEEISLETEKSTVAKANLGVKKLPDSESGDSDEELSSSSSSEGDEAQKSVNQQVLQKNTSPVIIGETRKIEQDGDNLKVHIEIEKEHNYPGMIPHLYSENRSKEKSSSSSSSSSSIAEEINPTDLSTSAEKDKATGSTSMTITSSDYNIASETKLQENTSASSSSSSSEDSDSESTRNASPMLNYATEDMVSHGTLHTITEEQKNKNSSSRSSSESWSDEKTNTERETAEDILSRGDDVHKAVEKGDFERVQVLVEAVPHLKETLDDKDWTPLHVAAAYGQVKIIQYLQTKGADLNTETMTGYTAIHLAAMNGHVNCMMALKVMGVSIDSRNIEGKRPVHLAAMSGHLETVKWLIMNKCDFEARDNNGRSATYFAKHNHHVNIVNYIALCRKKMGKPAESSSSSSSSSSSESDDEVEPVEVQPHSDLVRRKEEQDIMEKKKIYQEQQSKMLRRKTSFLEEIRMETEKDLQG